VERALLPACLQRPKPADKSKSARSTRAWKGLSMFILQGTTGAPFLAISSSRTPAFFIAAEGSQSLRPWSASQGNPSRAEGALVFGDVLTRPAGCYREVRFPTTREHRGKRLYGEGSKVEDSLRRRGRGSPCRASGFHRKGRSHRAAGQRAQSSRRSPAQGSL
jgi:hypothetical protein